MTRCSALWTGAVKYYGLRNFAESVAEVLTGRWDSQERKVVDGERITVDFARGKM